MWLLLLLTAVFCVREAYTGEGCPPAEAPLSDNLSIVNIATIDSRAIYIPRIVSQDQDGLNWVNDPCVGFRSCHPSPQDNWLLSPITDRPANINSFLLLINVTFNCSDAACSNALEFYIGEHDDLTTVNNFTRYREISVTNNVPTPISTTSPFINIAVRDNGTCVVVERFQLYYQACDTPYSPSPPLPFGATVSGLTCVSNTVDVSPTVSLTCNSGVFDSDYPCQCSAGYTGLNRISCTECPIGSFKDVVGDSECLSCPDRSSATSPASSLCSCDAGYVRSVPSDPRNACDECAIGYYMNGGRCDMCPAMSMSSGGTVDRCTCESPFVTRNGDTTTIAEPCDGCSTNYYLTTNGGGCEPCPGSSSAPSPNANTCTCWDGYYLEDDSTETTNVACFVRVGFVNTSLTVTEGDALSQSILITIRASAIINFKVTIAPHITTLLNVPEELKFENTDQASLTVTLNGNDIAFEEHEPLEIVIVNSADYFVGGDTSSGTLYGRLTLNIAEDDTVSVGFLSTTAMFNETQGMGQVDLVRIEATSIDLVIKASFDPEGIINFTQPVVTFPAGGSDTQPLVFTIVNDNSGFMETETTTITLSLVSPTQFQSAVIFGGEEFFDSIVVEILNDEPLATAAPLTLEAVIGIAVAGAGLAIIMFFIFVLVMCICRLQSINRQGFYLTNEDQSKEPPTMLRYSASLRSIASQTVVPVENAQDSMAKENEFYV